MQKSLNNFYWFGCTDQKIDLTDDVKNYKLNEKVLVNGKPNSLQLAIKELKEIFKNEKNIHFDGMICDQKSQSSIIDLAEKLRASINHYEHDEINNFYSAYQRYGASLVSFNEIKKRSDLVVLLGSFDDDTLTRFVKNTDWKNSKSDQSIYSVSSLKSSIIKQVIIERNLDLIPIRLLNLFGEKTSLKKFKNLQEKIMISKYPVIVINPKDGFIFTQKIFKVAEYINNNLKKIRIFRISGSNNSSGFVNNCVVKTGFPGSVNFNDWGLEYNPLKYTAQHQKDTANSQVFISSLNSTPSIKMFNENIFIGHPNKNEKKKFKIYIPVKTPGIDCDGLILRSDGAGMYKLDKKIDSDYIELKQLIDELKK